jgi:hypothetical protein
MSRLWIVAERESLSGDLDSAFVRSVTCKLSAINPF